MTDLTASPFILLDDARSDNAAPSRLYRDAVEIVVARRPAEVLPALARIGGRRGIGPG